MEISVIIPVYNAEKYLARCVDSILEALGQIKGEILLIDNNSTDGSPSIIRKYEKKYSKTIRTLKCDKWGAAAVRNYGTKKATGKYLWFVDADDYIDKNAIAKLLDTAREKKADLVMMGAERVNEAGARLSYLSAVDANDPNYKSRFVRYGMGPWQVIIRRTWWEKHGFSFMEGHIHEDMELMSSLILYTDKFASVDEPLYFYCQNDESVLHKHKFNPHIFDIFPVLESFYQRFEKAGAESLYHDEMEWFFIWNLLIDSAKDFAKFTEGKSGFGRSREMLKKYFPAWRKNKFLKQKPLKLRLLVRLNYYK